MGNWTDPAKQSPVTKIQLAESDIITFHNYDWPEVFEARIKSLQPFTAPSSAPSTWPAATAAPSTPSFPIAKKYNVGAINWGLVAGKTQTWLPWDSWQRPYVLIQPTIWFHEVFRQDDTPYRQHEVDLIRQLTGRGTPSM